MIWSIKYLKALSKIFYEPYEVVSSLFRCQKSDKIQGAKRNWFFNRKHIFSVKPQECLEDYNVCECVYKHFDGKSKSNAY